MALSMISDSTVSNIADRRVFLQTEQNIFNPLDNVLMNSYSYLRSFQITPGVKQDTTKSN